MKKLLLHALSLLFSLTLFASAPQTISYQAVVRGDDNELLRDSTISVKIAILLDNKKAVYTETRQVKTNANGLVTLSIGDEHATSAESISDIDWSAGSYFIHCGFDLTGGDDYTLTLSSQIMSVPYALYAERVAAEALPSWLDFDNKPQYTYTEIEGTPTIPTQVSELENDKHYLTQADLPATDSTFYYSVAYRISEKDTAYWNAKLDSYTETDPMFNASAAAKITNADIETWNKKLSQYTEQDPHYLNSTASKITEGDITNWNNKLSSFTEQDPYFTQSAAASIQRTDINNWNEKISTESDPIFNQSLAAKISSADTAYWNGKADKKDIPTVPTNVSQFNNDAQYVKQSELSGILTLLNQLSGKIDSVSTVNAQLTAKVSTLSHTIDSLTAPVYRQATTKKYGFATSSFNYGPDMYANLQNGDRIVFIVRHSERGSDYSVNGGLNDNGKNLAIEVGAKYQGGRAAVNDAYYASTHFKRCKETSYYIASSRGDSYPENMEAVNNPIDVLLDNYYGAISGWSNTAAWYENNKADVNEKSLTLINTCCELSAGKTFAWFTSHDKTMVPLIEWLTNEAISFTSPQWVNYMSGIAVIVHKDGAWEAYPVRNLGDGFLYQNY